MVELELFKPSSAGERAPAPTPDDRRRISISRQMRERQEPWSQQIAAELGGLVAADHAPSIRSLWPPGVPLWSAVEEILDLGGWYSSAALANRLACSDAGVTARVRELRRRGREVECRRARNGRYYYRLKPKS